jgi:PAS domain S-box-containing protein
VTAIARPPREASAYEERGGESAAAAGRVVFYDWDTSSDAISWSGDVREMLGVPAGDLPATRSAYLSYVLEHHRDRVRDGGGRLDAAGRCDLIYPIERGDGSTRWVRDAGHDVDSGTNGDPRIAGAIVDITDWRELVDTLVDQEERYQELLASAPVIVYTAPADDPTRTIGYTGGLGGVTGYLPEELEADPYLWAQIVHPDDLPGVLAALEDAVSRRGSFREEYRYITREGRVVWVADEGRVVEDRSGTLVIRGVIVEVTRARTAELERQRVAGQSRTLTELSRELAETERDIDELLDTVAHQIGDALSASCTVRLLEDDGGRFGRSAVHHPDPGTAEHLRRLLATADRSSYEGAAGHALASDRAVVHLDGRDGDELAAAVVASPRGEGRDLDIVDAMAAAVRVAGDDLGVLVCARHGTAPPFDRSDERFLRGIADRVALAVSNARLYEEAVEAEDHARRAAEEMSELLHRHHVALNAARVAVWEWNIVEDYVAWTGPSEAITGIPAGTVDRGHDSFLDLVHPDDRAGKDSAIDAALAGEEDYEREFRIIPAGTDRVVWVRSVAEISRDDAGDPKSMVGVLIDVTEQRETQDELAHFHDRLRLAFQAGSIASWDWDVASGRVGWSPALERMFGLEPGGFGGTLEHVLELIHPDDRQALLDAVDRSFAGGQRDYALEHRALRPDGEVRWLLSHGRVMRDARGEPSAITGVTLDITDRKLTEVELAARAAQQSGVAELSQLALTAEDLETVFARALELAAETLDMPFAVLAERDPRTSEFRLRAQVGFDAALLDGMPLVGRPTPEILDLLDRDEPIIIDGLGEGIIEADPGLLTAQGVRSGLGVNVAGRTEVFGVLAVLDRQPRSPTADDVTFLRAVANVLAGAVARSEAEEHLVHAQKMEAVGRLSGGIAHDFNNLLTVMLGFGELLEPAVADDPAATEDLSELLAAAGRAAQLVDQLLTFSRGQSGADEACDLGVVLGSIGPMLARLVGEDVALAVSAVDEDLPVALDRVRVEQIILNLVVNARDALDGGGRIILVGELTEDGPASHGTAAPRPHVRLRVIDDGEGMDERTIDRALEPFFTTKDAGQGTGLGLSTVYGIVRQAGGTLDLASRPGLGTTVTVLLPCADGSPESGPELAHPTHDRGQAAGRILLVEDQAIVRRLVREVLSRRGYDVAEAANGPEALDLVDDADIGFDLVLTDVVMPQMSGAELVGELRDREPGIRVLYMSGHTDQAMPDAPLIAKPFRADELARAVHDALRQPA